MGIDYSTVTHLNTQVWKRMLGSVYPTYPMLVFDEYTLSEDSGIWIPNGVGGMILSDEDAGIDEEVQGGTDIFYLLYVFSMISPVSVTSATGGPTWTKKAYVPSPTGNDSNPPLTVYASNAKYTGDDFDIDLVWDDDIEGAVIYIKRYSNVDSVELADSASGIGDAEKYVTMSVTTTKANRRIEALTSSGNVNFAREAPGFDREAPDVLPWITTGGDHSPRLDVTGTSQSRDQASPDVVTFSSKIYNDAAWAGALLQMNPASSSSSSTSSSSSSSRSSSSKSSSSTSSISSSSSSSSSRSSSSSSRSSSSSSRSSSSSSSSSRSSSSSSTSSSSSSNTGGDITWGRETSDEQVTEPFEGEWVGGVIDGTGNAETLTLTSDSDVSVSDTVYVGPFTGMIYIDKYDTGEGPAPKIEYKTGETENICDAFAWHEYDGSSFESLGWVKLKLIKQ